MLEPWLTSDVLTSRVVPISGTSTSTSTSASTSTSTSTSPISSASSSLNANTTTANNNNNNNKLPSQPYAMLSAHIPHLHLSSIIGGGMLIHLEIGPMKNIILDRNLTSRTGQTMVENSAMTTTTSSTSTNTNSNSNNNNNNNIVDPAAYLSPLLGTPLATGAPLS